MPLEDKNNRIKGIISIILSAAGFAGMAFFVKLSGDVPVMEKAMFRNAVAAAVAFSFRVASPIFRSLLLSAASSIYHL